MPTRCAAPATSLARLALCLGAACAPAGQGAPAREPGRESERASEREPESAAAGDPAAAEARRESERARARDELAALGYSGWDEPRGEVARGAIVHDRARVAPGWNLYTDERDRILAVDAEGALRREWRVPGRTQVELAVPLEGGRLVALSVDEGLTLLERDGSVAWSLDLPCHHDLAVRPGDPPGERVLAVATHREREHAGRRVLFDEVVFVAEATGEPIGEERLPRLDSFVHREAWARIQREGEGRPHPLDAPATGEAPPDERRYDYFHLNSLAWEVDARGRDALLLCLRNVDTVALVDLAGEVLWHADPRELDWPHMPRRIAREGGGGAPGDVLVFDNGRHRGHSRAVAFGPSGAVTWTWQAEPKEAFYSELRGAVQRLENGNTLLTESERGRAFELAPDGALVWEFRNPERSEGRVRRIYRLMRYPSALLEAP